MTKEEKAKAYDKVREKIAIRFGSNVADEIFSQFEMSENERIRKNLISYIFISKHPMFSERERNEMLAWLEKQGEKNSTDEPKFKVGDWIIHKDNKHNPVKIIEKIGMYYIIVDAANYHHNIYIDYINENYRLWAIQDAKDGDVLQLGKVTAIFKEFIGNEHCKCYCSICNGEFEIPSQDGVDNDYGCYDAAPATKEQRDLLFQNMHEACYEWDSEKKELKKMEQNTAWSEYDEKMFRSLHNLIYVVRDCDCNSMKKEELSDWLKSVKDKVQPHTKQKR